MPFKVGIEYDPDIAVAFPNVNDSLAQNNNGVCSVCYCEFDPEDFKADSLACGHQYCCYCWEGFIKSDVQSDGAASVLTTCP